MSAIFRSRFNASTGDTVHDVNGSEAVRIVQSAGRLPIYHAEAWGDYSLAFPIRAPWRDTIEAATRDVARLRRKARAR